MECYLNDLFPRLGITAEDIKECEGMTIKDAAYILGVSYTQLRRKLNTHPEIKNTIFPHNRAEGRWMAERGYAL